MVNRAFMFRSRGRNERRAPSFLRNSAERPESRRAGPSDRGLSVSEQLSDARVRRGRVIFDTFRSARDPRLAAWLMFRSHLLPDEAPAPRASTSTSAPTSATVPVGVFGVWRLLASNNRELARCATVFASPAVAVETAIAEQSRAV